MFFLPSFLPSFLSQRLDAADRGALSWRSRRVCITLSITLAHLNCSVSASLYFCLFVKILSISDSLALYLSLVHVSPGFPPSFFPSRSATGLDPTPSRMATPQPPHLARKLDMKTAVDGLWMTGQDTLLCGVPMAQVKPDQRQSHIGVIIFLIVMFITAPLTDPLQSYFSSSSCLSLPPSPTPHVYNTLLQYCLASRLLPW